MRYRTIVADPPWPYKDRATLRQRQNGKAQFLPYGSMELPQIAATVGSPEVAVDAHLYLWTTQRFLWDVRGVLLGAGYLPQQVLVWCKPPNGVGMGGAFPPTVEFCVFARRNWGWVLDHRRREAGLTIADLHEAVRGGPPTGLVGMWMKGERYPNEIDWQSLEDVLGDLGPRAGLPRPASSSWFEWPRGPHSAKPDGFLDLVEQVSPGPYLELFARRARFGWDYWGDESLGTAHLDGGGEEVVAVGRRPPLEASSQAAVGSQPVPVVSAQPGQHPTNFDDGGDAA